MIVSESHHLPLMLLHFLDWFCLRGRGYQFWSGIGSGSPLLGGLYILWRKHNCHERFCPRLIVRAHPDDAGHLVCRRHHPDL